MINSAKCVIIRIDYYTLKETGEIVDKKLNVLLSLMQLDIGGAETHVVELAKELARKGINPIVTSNGGAYEAELKESGIKHYCVPLQNKNPINMLKSVKLLRRIIKDENIDIVHSHARIPSFILGKMQKRMKFPFVTTAHWVFTTKWGLKYITDWGEKSVAVSEDIKLYLMDNYGVPEGNINVTINGIDTDKFSPDTDRTAISRELGINETDTVIVYVSRLDESRSLVAKQLINIVPRIDGLVENLKVVIVGDGDDFGNVKAMTARVNKELGRECIVLTGARTDINRLVSPADLFIGVSRAALEAMAAEKPVIIAGNEGYIGLFDHSKLDVGIDTNFCCRGCSESSEALLYADIEKFFGLTDNEKHSLAVYGRELIKREYSVSRMADDTIRVYRWALDKQDEILISGYYGFKNSGDDALLQAIIDDIKKHKESPNITVLSANPRETAKHYRVNAINRFSVIQLLRHMKNAGMLISGGGTLIQDATSTKSLIYYLAVIKLAIRRGVKVMLYSNGIGPLRNEANIVRAKKALDNVDVITLRDPESERELTSLDISKPDIFLTADPVFGIDTFDKAEGHKILDRFGVPKDGRVLVVSVRKTRDTNASFETTLANMCDYAAEKYNCSVVFVPMQINKDEQISKSIMMRMKNAAYLIDTRLSVNECISVMAAADACIGMRLHSLIYSAIGNVPVIGISYDPKIKGFMSYVGQDICIDINDVTDKTAYKSVDTLFASYDAIKEQLREGYLRLKDKAELNGELAVRLYEKGSVDLAD